MQSRLFCIAVSAAFLLVGCRTIPDLPSQMTCEDLNYIAHEELDSDKLPFFITQLLYPGDWRHYASDRWISEGSRKQVRINRKDYLQMEVLTIGNNPNDQTAYRVRIPLASCKNAAEKPTGEMTFINYLKDAPDKSSQVVKFNFKGTETQDQLARMICGYQSLPERNKAEEMAVRWKDCQKPQK